MAEDNTPPAPKPTLAEQLQEGRKKLKPVKDDWDIGGNESQSQQASGQQPEQDPVQMAQNQSSPELSEVAEPLAHDTVIFGPVSNIEAPSIDISEVIDPITQAIRDQLITMQQLYLQQEIAKEIEEPAKSEFLNQDLIAIRAYLQTEEGREAVQSVMKKPENQSAIHAMEASGYKTIHTQFQDSFKDVDWGEKTDNVRLSEIRNDDGELVSTLKETTIDTKPTQITLEDGTVRTVKSYREIDFPKELETSKGPLHLSMAVKDENGKNIPEKSAVYFTAHYDDDGKLTEVSSPMPVKFMGEGPEAIGYIERNGRVYTLPVTQGKYHEMMQEVAKNNGIGANIGQSLESQDYVLETRENEKGKQKQKLQPAVMTQIEEGSAIDTKGLTQAAEDLSSAISGMANTGKANQKLQPAKLTEVQDVSSTIDFNALLQASDDVAKATHNFVNIITGNTVSAEVMQKSQEVRTNLEHQTGPSLKATKDHQEYTLEMLNGKTPQEAKEIISNVIKQGNANLAGAMVEAVSDPDEGSGIPKLGKVVINKIYLDGMEHAKTLQNPGKANVQRAAGAIADKAGIVDHDKRVAKPEHKEALGR